MLTKEERAAIAERANRAKYSMDSIFEILHGYSSPEYMSLKDDFIAMVTRVLDLCDTSNMVELPVDKDGEVIKLGDTLYDDEGTKIKVCGFLLREIEGKILLDINANNGFVVMSANNLTHKKPVTIKSLVKKLTDIVAADYGTPMVVKRKLSDIADQLESLGDNNE